MPDSAGCSCLPGFRHQTPNDSRTPCSLCLPGASPKHCLPCEGCVYSQVCVDPEDRPSGTVAPPPGQGLCVCAPQYRTLTGVAQRPGIHCFPLDIAAKLDVITAQAPAGQELRTALSILGPEDLPPTPIPRWHVFAYAHTMAGYAWVFGSAGVCVAVVCVLAGLYLWKRSHSRPRVQ